jgi:transposase
VPEPRHCELPSDAGGERADAIYTLLGAAKFNGLDPELYLRHVLERIADHPVNRTHELLPWNLATALPTHLTRSQVST